MQHKYTAILYTYILTYKHKTAQNIPYWDIHEIKPIQTNTQKTQYNAACSSIYCIKQHRLIYLTSLIHATIAKFHEILNTSREFSSLTTVSFKSVNTQSTSKWILVGKNCVLLYWEQNTRTTVIQIYTQSSHLHTAIKQKSQLRKQNKENSTHTAKKQANEKTDNCA